MPFRPTEFLITGSCRRLRSSCSGATRATPGRCLGARIVDAKTGEAPSVAQLVGRYLAYFVSTTPLCLGLIWVGFDRRKQGWHDKLASTVVIRSKRHGKEPVRFG